jgi:4-carboxymuconolactone decarboxylase
VREMRDSEYMARATEIYDRIAPRGAVPPWDDLADLAPALGELVARSLGTVLARPGLDLRTREIATVCMLAAVGDSRPQLEFHIRAALRVGVSPTELVEALTQVAIYAGVPRALNAVAAARPVLAGFRTVDAPAGWAGGMSA